LISSLANDVSVVDAAGVDNYVAAEDVADIIVNYEN